VYPLDWLRVLALLGVFVYHSMRPFDTEDWHVKNAEQSGAITVVLGLMAWGLPLFFLLAGAGSVLALRWRTPTRYARERLLRLAVPLLVAYVLFSPLQSFIQETHFDRYHGSLLASISPFFRAEWANLRGGPGLPLVVAWAGHLWFLIFLLWFSLLGLPVLVLLRRPVGQRLVARAARGARRRGAILLWTIPLALIHAALPAPGGVEHGWGDFVVFFDVFLAGALLLADRRLVEAVRRDLIPAVCLAAAATVALGISVLTGLVERWADGPAYSWASPVVYVVMTVWAWAWMMLAVSLGLRTASFQRPLPPPVGRAAMPFFLVHQPVILAVAVLVVPWPVGIAVKLPIVLGAALVVSAALAVGLSRLPYVSTLLGVKRR
jgi:peptidoglycan/LPS O-acetylase OafA/YrhL